MPNAVEVAGLVDEFTPFALEIAARWGRRYLWLADDFASDATLELWRAATRFDPARGAFTRWATFKISRAIGRRLRVERRRNPLAFHRRPAAADGEDLDPLDLLAGDEPEPGERIAAVEEVAAAFDRAELSERYRAVFTRHVGQDVPMTELAAEAGVSANRVRQIVLAARAKLRAAAEIAATTA